MMQLRRQQQQQQRRRWQLSSSSAVLCVLLLATLTAAEEEAEWRGSPGWVVAEPESVEDARLMDVSSPPKACRAVIPHIAWGVATAAYQIEGAHNRSGKSASIWDTFVRQPGKIRGGGTGDVATDFYRRYKDDVALMKQLGVKHHRFSLAWTRILPEGVAGSPVNERGVAYYNNLINEMLAAGITPVATIYHWDLPQSLQDAYGGFLGGDQFVRDYEAYASTVFELFGDRVKHWITFNEPPMICEGYKDVKFAPGAGGGRKAYYTCGHNLLRAHVAAAKSYRTFCQREQRGQIGLTTNVVWAEPLTDSFEDKRAARNKMEREFGWLLDPVTKGDYPDILKRSINNGDLPSFSEEEKRDLAGSIDFVGVNVYTARYVLSKPGAPDGFRETSKGKDGKDIGFKTNDWLYAVPGALGGVLAYVGLTYNKLQTMVTEFGTNVKGEEDMSDEEVLHDAYRIQFYHAYLNTACQAIQEHDLNVTAMFAWTFEDNFEWVEGFNVPYGLVHIDRRSGSLARRPKDSALWWSQNFFTQTASRLE